MNDARFDEVVEWIRNMSSGVLVALLEELQLELRGRRHMPEAGLVELAKTVLEHRLSGAPPRLDR